MDRLLASLVLVLAAAIPASGQSVGDDARDLPLAAADWLHLVGEPPTMRALEGRAVLIHFFSVDPKAGVKGANWPILRKFAHDHAAKGLVVIALCDQPLEDVREYVQGHDMPFLVGAGASCREAWGVTGNFGQVLVEPKGTVFWRGPTNGLWNGKLLKAVRPSKRLGVAAHLALGAGVEFPAPLEKAAGRLAEGKLSKGARELDAVLARETLAKEVRDAALDWKNRLGGHVARLLSQIDAELTRGDAPAALEVLEALAKELSGTDLGRAPAERLEAVKGDRAVARQIEAAERFETILAAYWKRGLEKNKARLERLIDEFPETHAAQRARNLLAGR